MNEYLRPGAADLPRGKRAFPLPSWILARLDGTWSEGLTTSRRPIGASCARGRSYCGCLVSNLSLHVDPEGAITGTVGEAKRRMVT